MVSSTFQIGAMLGPVLSGVLVGVVGPGSAFAMTRYLVGPLTALAMMRLPPFHGERLAIGVPG